MSVGTVCQCIVICLSVTCTNLYYLLPPSWFHVLNYYICKILSAVWSQQIKYIKYIVYRTWILHIVIASMISRCVDDVFHKWNNSLAPTLLLLNIYIFIYEYLAYRSRGMSFKITSNHRPHNPFLPVVSRYGFIDITIDVCIELRFCHDDVVMLHFRTMSVCASCGPEIFRQHRRPK